MGKFALVDDGVEREIELDAARVRLANQPRKLIELQLAIQGSAHIKTPKAKVERIGPRL